MKPVAVVSYHAITSLGFSTGEAAVRIKEQRTGLEICSDRLLTPAPMPLSLVPEAELEQRFGSLPEIEEKKFRAEEFTKLEKLLILSIRSAAGNWLDRLKGTDTILVVSTTKGNIHLLEGPYRGRFDPDRLFLWKLAEVVKGFFGFAHRPVVISNACISGVLAISHAARLLASGKYRNAVVAGGDILSEFIISGFISFQALSPGPCRPFDISRNGLSLGEGAATVILSADPDKEMDPEFEVAGSAMTNDANHISGPSRTGEELALAIRNSMQEAGLSPAEIDFISAHGTATVYNDEMESKAFSLAGLSGSPLNSFKGLIGHTLGGAGIIESAFSLHSMKENILYPSAGFSDLGVPEKIRVITAPEQREIRSVLKTASGFGGCNAAIIFRKKGSGA